MRSLLTVIALLTMFALFSGQTTEAQIEAIVPFFVDITVPIPIEASAPFCGVRVGNPEASGGLPLIGDEKKTWPNGTTLKVAVDFSGTSSSDSDFVSDFVSVCNIGDSVTICQGKVIALILARASEWSKWGNIYFQYTPSWNDGDIRIRFDAGDELHSRIGTEYVARSKKTMNLDIKYWNPLINDIRGTIVHEFGHAIGLEHEHKRPDSPYKDILDIDKIHAYYAGEPHHWLSDKTDEQVINPLDYNSHSYMRTAYDDKSIMRYSLPLSFVKKEYQGQCPALATSSFCVMPNFELSFLDTDGICRLYPYEIGGTESASIGTRRHYYLNAGGGDGLAGGGPEGGVKVINRRNSDPAVSDELWWIEKVFGGTPLQSGDPVYIRTRRNYYLNAGGGDGLAGGGPEGMVKVVNHHHPDPEVSDEIWWIQ